MTGDDHRPELWPTAAARLLVWLAIAAALALLAVSTAEGATATQPNFLVTGPELAAHQVAEAAEEARARLAREWLGETLPAWRSPARVTVEITSGNSGGGSTTFAHTAADIQEITGHWTGPLDRLVSDVVPHEVYHLVMASHFRRPLPRWWDEGGATFCESIAGRQTLRTECATALSRGRGIPFSRAMLAMEYPRDFAAFYGQSAEMAEFLIVAGGRRAYVGLMEETLRSGSWSAGLRQVYGIESSDQYATLWQDWARAGMPYPDGWKGERERVYCWQPGQRSCNADQCGWFPGKWILGNLLRPAHPAPRPARPGPLPSPPTAAPSPRPPAGPGPGQTSPIENPLVKWPPANCPDVSGQVDQMLAGLEEVRGIARQLADRSQPSVDPAIIRATIRDGLAGLSIAAPDSGAATGLAGLLAALGWTGPPAAAALGAVYVLRGLMRLRRAGSEPATQSRPTKEPPPVVLHDPAPPLRQRVVRDRDFVEVEVPSPRLRALQMALDEYVRRYPGARGAVETIETYADQFESSLTKTPKESPNVPE